MALQEQIQQHTGIIFFLMNLTSLFAVSLYNYSKSVNSSAVKYLILAALIYFMFFLAYSGMTMLCGNAVKQLKAVTSSADVWERKVKLN